VREVDDSDSEIKLAKTPETLKDGGKAMVDELKELNLENLEEPRPIYVSSLLTFEEEEYFNLLGKYKDVFAWSYQGMPGLDLRLLSIACPLEKVCRLKSSRNDIFD